MEMNNEAIRYIEALREQYAPCTLAHFLRLHLTLSCVDIVCLKVKLKI
jgi:hypothetical protein